MIGIIGLIEIIEIIIVTNDNSSNISIDGNKI